MRLLLFFALPLPALAASAGAQALRSASAAPPIQDNSFLVEEAYNQERGVVQHINTFARSTHGGSWVYTFTQEWPLGGQRHQIGFTLPVEGAPSSDDRGTGIGDVAINYRFQIAGLGDGGERGATAFAPRMSLLLPTGSSRGRLGVRTAFDFASGMQIVPGLAFPIGVGPSRGERSVFVYLSLEHHFAREAP